MYFFGFSKYSYKVSSPHSTAFSLLDLEYENPSTVPEVRPNRPPRLGPCAKALKIRMSPLLVTSNKTSQPEPRQRTESQPSITAEPLTWNTTTTYDCGSPCATFEPHNITEIWLKGWSSWRLRDNTSKAAAHASLLAAAPNFMLRHC